MAKSLKKDRWAGAVPSKEAQYSAKRLALICEAAKAFTKNGFHNTSLDDVAVGLGVSKPTLYYYVKTKQEILYECHNMALDLGVKAREQAYAATSRPDERLRLYFLTYIEALTENIGIYGVLREPLSSLPPEFRNPIVKRLRLADKNLQELVRANIDAGTIPPCNPRIAVAFFMGAINHIARWYSPDGELSGKEIAASYTEFILNGLRGRTAPRRAK